MTISAKKNAVSKIKSMIIRAWREIFIIERGTRRRAARKFVATEDQICVEKRSEG
jgi:hypothetical protein